MLRFRFNRNISTSRCFGKADAVRVAPTTGHLFERRYRATLVDTNPYWLALVRYIHRNPVEAGIVADPVDYPWSSHRCYLGRGSPGWLTVEPTLAMFGCSTADAVAAYRRFIVEEARDETLDAVRHSAVCGAEEPPRGFEFRDQKRLGLQSLEQVVLEVVTEFDIDRELLASGCRDSKLVRARLEVARRALAAGVASLTTVAARLGRSPSTLSEQLNRR